MIPALLLAVLVAAQIGARRLGAVVGRVGGPGRRAGRARRRRRARPPRAARCPTHLRKGAGSTDDGEVGVRVRVPTPASRASPRSRSRPSADARSGGRRVADQRGQASVELLAGIPALLLAGLVALQLLAVGYSLTLADGAAEAGALAVAADRPARAAVRDALPGLGGRPGRDRGPRRAGERRAAPAGAASRRSPIGSRSAPPPGSAGLGGAVSARVQWRRAAASIHGFGRSAPPIAATHGRARASGRNRNRPSRSEPPSRR